MLVSPAYYLQGFCDPEESTEALLFGQVLHGRLLEPRIFADRFHTKPKVSRMTRDGKALSESHRIEACCCARFPAHWMEAIDAIVANVCRHGKAREIFATGEAEVVIARINLETGIKCKIRID